MAGTPTVAKAEFLRHIDGVIYGDSPSEGIVRGNLFLHPELRLSIAFPEGWAIQNTRSQVVAKAPERERYLLLQLVQNPQGSIEQVAQSGMANAGYRQIEGERTTINGLQAYVGTYQGRTSLGNVGVLAAHIAHNDRVYVFAGLAPAGEFQDAQREFALSIRTFKALSASEAAAIRPNRVDMYTVRGGDTWASIAERAGKGILKPSTLAIMNNSSPGTPPRAGERIKIVVAG